MTDLKARHLTSEATLNPTRDQTQNTGPNAQLHGTGERGQQTVAGPQIPLGHQTGEERADLGQDRGTLQPARRR